MDIGMIGLGRMGGNMAERLVRGGHRVVGYSRSKERVEAHVKAGGVPSYSPAELIAKLAAPRIVWLMIPQGKPVDDMIGTLGPLMGRGDTLVDGGNSYYKDSMRRASELEPKGISYIDCGTSGGIWGAEGGYSLMIGGESNAVLRLRPLFETLAPTRETGWARVGASGAGHFVKMVHNGIEYGLMQAYAEGFTILGAKAEFDLDLHEIAEVWRYGSVVRSWLLDLAADALGKNPTLAGIGPQVADSGEGRWTVEEALDLNVSAPIITLALERRIRSREEAPFGDKLLAMLRNEFGGHAVSKEAP
ncbi:MAG: phosphogluconate dehydrogenase (NAD(+)-dependent, decarboxylating) [Thermoplasmatota archaeon]